MLENYANFLVKPDEDILTFDVPDDVLERTDGNSEWGSQFARGGTPATGPYKATGPATMTATEIFLASLLCF